MTQEDVLIARMYVEDLKRESFCNELNTISRIIDMRLPRKPIEQIKLIGLDKGGKCSTCHKYVNNNQHWMYCECGQKLDWSE